MQAFLFCGGLWKVTFLPPSSYLAHFFVILEKKENVKTMKFEKSEENMFCVIHLSSSILLRDSSILLFPRRHYDHTANKALI